MNPILIAYIRTPDKGMELRHSLRSYKNILNWNGQVFIVGDKERWFKNINHIPFKRTFGNPYLDQVKKFRHALSFMPETFIISQDDVYITEPTWIGAYYLGELTRDLSSRHKRTKSATWEWLLSRDYPTKDYEAHAPMLVEKSKLMIVLDLIIDEKLRNQWRSMYGNMFNVDCEPFIDAKSKTRNLKYGKITSTHFYTDELDVIFPDKSELEL